MPNTPSFCPTRFYYLMKTECFIAIHDHMHANVSNKWYYTYITTSSVLMCHIGFVLVNHVVIILPFFQFFFSKALPNKHDNNCSLKRVSVFSHHWNFQICTVNVTSYSRIKFFTWIMKFYHPNSSPSHIKWGNSYKEVQ